MSASANRPRVPTVVTPASLPGSKTTIVSRERIALKQPTISVKDITDEKGNVSADGIVRVLGLIQAAISDSTASARSDPLGMKCIVHGVALTSGSNTNIKHTLGEPWKYAIVLSSTSGSASCILNRTATPPANIDQSQYASITPTGTGTYDVAIFPG